VCLHEDGKEALVPRPLGRGTKFILCFSRLEGSRLLTMLCGGFVVCLHAVGKEASDPRHPNTSIELEGIELSALLCVVLVVCLHEGKSYFASGER
jgi:hypothetical protein